MARVDLERAVKFLNGTVIICRFAENIDEPEVGADIYVVGLFCEGGRVPFFSFVVMFGVKIGVTEMHYDLAVVRF